MKPAALHIDDEAATVFWIELAPQIADVDVDHVGLQDGPEVPDIFQQHGARYDLPRVAHEILEQLEFARLQFDFAPLADDAPLDDVHFDRAGPQTRGAPIRRAPQQGLRARNQLANCERLDEVVVAARCQSVDPIVDGRQAADDQGRRRVSLVA